MLTSGHSEAQEAEETWIDSERQALDSKIDRALEQVATGRVYGSEGAVPKMRSPRSADGPGNSTFGYVYQ